MRAGPRISSEEGGPCCSGKISAYRRTAAAMTDPRFAEIESHRPYMLRYALPQLRKGPLAEEAVQEALASALESVGSFNGQSSLRTWLTSILRYKVIDCSGARSRTAPTSRAPRRPTSTTSRG